MYWNIFLDHLKSSCHIPKIHRQVCEHTASCVSVHRPVCVCRFVLVCVSVDHCRPPRAGCVPGACCVSAPASKWSAIAGMENSWHRTHTRTHTHTHTHIHAQTDSTHSYCHKLSHSLNHTPTLAAVAGGGRRTECLFANQGFWSQWDHLAFFTTMPANRPHTISSKWSLQCFACNNIWKIM